MGQTTQRGIKEQNCLDLVKRGFFWRNDMPCEEPFGHRTILNATDDEFNNGLWQWLVNHECYKSCFGLLEDDRFEIASILRTAKPNERLSEFPDFIFRKGFDFKLFTSQSKLQAAKILSPSIQEIMPGVISFGLSEKHEGVPGYKPITYSIPYAVFRSLNRNEMIEIREKKEKEDVLEKDVSQIIKTFETKKNIMLFFPYNFNFDSNDNFEQGRKLAFDGLNADFKYLFQYRMDRLPEYDTYVSFIYEKENFVIGKWTGAKLEFVEMIPVYKSSLYCELWHIAEG